MVSPDAAGFRVDSHRMRQRRGCGRAWVAGRLVVALSLVAAASSCAAGDDLRTVEPAAGHSWSQTHRVDLPSGWTVTARNVGPADESTSLSGPGSKGCLVSTSPEEPEHYWRGSSGSAVVQGLAASYGKRDPDYGPYPAQVVWQARGRWFGVSCDLDRTGILELAARVRAEPTPLRVPFRLTSVPDGLQLTQLIEWVDGGTVRVSA